MGWGKCLISLGEGNASLAVLFMLAIYFHEKKISNIKAIFFLGSLRRLGESMLVYQ